MSIQIQTAKVYYAPTRGKRYFTKRGAINAEARAIIYKYYEKVNFEHDTGYFEDLEVDRPDYFATKYNALVRALKNRI